MFVVVIAVRRVQVPVVQIIHMVPVRHGHVPTIRSVHVVVLGVLDATFHVAGVPMVVVLVVQVTIVDVIDVVAVWNRDVSAVGAVHMGMVGVGPVLHDPSMSFVAPSGSSLSSDVVSNGAWIACGI